jgi:hypothetical protein
MLVRSSGTGLHPTTWLLTRVASVGARAAGAGAATGANVCTAREGVVRLAWQRRGAVVQRTRAQRRPHVMVLHALGREAQRRGDAGTPSLLALGLGGRALCSLGPLESHRGGGDDVRAVHCAGAWTSAFAVWTMRCSGPRGANRAVANREPARRAVRRLRPSPHQWVHATDAAATCKPMQTHADTCMALRMCCCAVIVWPVARLKGVARERCMHETGRACSGAWCYLGRRCLWERAGQSEGGVCDVLADCCDSANPSPRCRPYCA